MTELVRQIADLQRRVDGLVKPEVPLGLSLISETVLTVNAASVTFSDIPQGFRALALSLQLRYSSATEVDYIRLRFNADAGNNYDCQELLANGATLAGLGQRALTSAFFGVMEGASARASNWSPTLCFIFDYSRPAAETWMLALSAAFGNVSADTDLFSAFEANRWRSTVAVTSITLLPNSGNLVAGSRLTLYGVY